MILKVTDEQVFFSDDHGDEADILRDALRDIGAAMPCSIVTNGKASLNNLENCQYLPDIVLFDITKTPFRYLHKSSAIIYVTSSSEVDKQKVQRLWRTVFFSEYKKIADQKSLMFQIMGSLDSLKQTYEWN